MNIIDFTPLETNDLLVFVSFLLVVVGWYIKVKQDRKFEIFKRRLDMRMKAFESVLPVLKHISEKKDLNHPEMKEWLESSRSLFQLYANKEEEDLFEKFIEGINENDLEKVNSVLPQISLMVVDSIRKDLGLN
ncbi:hypothetical protein [Terasakiella sp.]|uniref:hypothetical protein n=1 Tax=Terasakiella sp. TaxID=2034861 RepID=UPI003AA8197B